MSDQVQLRGGTTAQHTAFTGALREVTVDTDKKTVVVHDGATAGGFPLARESAATTAQAQADAAGVYGCRGLLGNVNSGTPLTKYDLSASAVSLRNAAGAVITRYTTGTLTCDLGLAGSAANGRDQAAAFTANSWVYLYFVWNGTTLATLASASSSAPTLPSGYTHYALATVLRWNASSNIVACYARGKSVSYVAQQTSLAGGSATATTLVSVSTIVPPNALTFQLTINSIAGSTTAGGVLDMTSTIEVVSGSTFHSSHFAVAGAASSGQYDSGPQLTLPNVGQSYNYFSTVSTGSGPSVVHSVNGFTVPNGDA